MDSSKRRFGFWGYGRLSGRWFGAVEVDLGNGHGNYSMTMYVADITDNCILGLDYLKLFIKAREYGWLIGSISKQNVPPVRTHEVRLVNDCHIFF